MRYYPKEASLRLTVLTVAVMAAAADTRGQSVITIQHQDPDPVPPVVQTNNLSRHQRVWFRDRFVSYVDVEGMAVAEGDIVLGPAASLRRDVVKGRPGASVIVGTQYRWPNGIVPYVIDTEGSRNSGLRTTVARAIAHWESRTGYRFPAWDSRVHGNNRVVFSARQSGCFSQIGMIGGPQTINLESGCGTGAAIHEIGHAIGLWHEQSRNDRDSFVSVLRANIDAAMLYNFNVSGPSGEDTGYYDYASIMHYPPNGFSMNGRDTLTTIPAGIPIGQREELSQGDIAVVEGLRGVNNRPYVVSSNPLGATLVVDGRTCTAPCVFSDWTPGSRHTIEAPESFGLAPPLSFARWNDDGGRVHEISANPDKLVVTANFKPGISGDRPDLVVTRVNAPESAAAGELLSGVVVEFANIGAVRSGRFRVGFYLSANPTITTGDIFTGWFCIVEQGLAENTAFRCSGDIRLPSDIPSGVYYFGALADDLGEVEESNELNNGRENQTGTTAIASTATGRPDLTITGFTAPVSGVAGGRLSGVRVGIRNSGLAVSGKFRLGFYLVPTEGDPIYTGWSCTESRGLAAGDSWTCAGDIGIPTDVLPGKFYLVAAVDDLDEVEESNETNNFRLNDLGVVTVETGQPELPDLIITSLTAPNAGIAGGRIDNTRVAVSNQGTGAAGAFRIAYYLSPVSREFAPVFTGWTCAVDGGLASNAVFTCGGQIGIPSTLPAGTYDLIAVADDLRSVTEANDANNSRVADSGPVRITRDGAARADLTVTNVTAPSAAISGSSITVSATVRNQGSVASGSYRLGFYLSTTSAISTGGIRIGTCAMNSLPAGSTTTCSGPLSLAAGLPPGNYYVGAVADDLGQIDEADETNNTLVASGLMSVTAPPRADLTLTSVSAPSSAVAGTSVTFSAIARNQGTAPSGSFRLSFYLSANSTISVADLRLGSCNMNSISPGATGNCSGPLLLSASLPAGTYFVGGIADDQNQVDESDEGNNILLAGTPIVITAAPKPDLVVTSVSAPPSAAAGEIVTMSAGIRNAGNAPSGGYRVSFYLSGNTTISTLDLRLASCDMSALTAGGTATCSGPVNIPASVAPGVYYVGVVADDTGQVEESDESNNFLRAAGTITITGALKPDLTLTGVSGPASGVINANITVSAGIRNQGASASGAYRVSFFLSTIATITPASVRLGSCTMVALAAGASTTCSGPLQVPASVAPGTYRLGAAVDDLNQVDEANENNNVLFSDSAITILAPARADLTVTAISAPASGVLGGNINVTATVRNFGNAPSGAYRLSFYLSTNSTITTFDFRIGSCNMSSLAAGSSTTCSGPLTLPLSLGPGFYYLGVIADDLGQVDESDEFNNVAVTGGMIQVQRP